MSLKKLTHRTPNGTNYAYLHSAPQASKPYLLFLHGFPESSYDWTNQTTHLVKAGYGIIAPDLLGYGDTDKPKDPREYRFKKMADEVVSILDHHSIKQCISIGHDTGCGLQSSLAAFRRERFSAFAFLAIGHIEPGNFDIAALNKTTEHLLGYPAFGYWDLHNSPDAEDLYARNPLSATSLWFSNAPQQWQKNVLPPGAARSWLENQRTAPLPGWLTPEIRETCERILAEGGWNGPLNWYRMYMAGYNDADAEGLTEAQKRIDDRPVLFIETTGEQDTLPGEFWEKAMREKIRDLKVVKTGVGHWLMWEDPEGVNRALEEFVGSVEVM